MCKSDLNIKHANKTHLYWGIDKTTGEVVGIDEVASRGLNCNCRCAACGRDFIARKGEKNRHHFAHQSNYECVYANEIAVYMLVKQMLVKSNTILLPAVSLEIGSRVEQVKEQRTAYVGDVFYHCDPEQYPPLLIVDIDGRRTRVVLQFGKYFTDEDYRMLRGEAKRKDWDCLAVSLPSIIGENSLDIRTIRETVFEGVREKKWIHTNMAESWKVRFMEAAKTPPLAQNAPAGKMYECPIHRVRYNGRPIVRPVDCSKCPYSLAVYPECKCLAFEGIQSVKDFDLAREQRREIIDRVRRENDERYELAVQERERKEKLRSFVSMNRQFAQQTPRPQPARTVMTYEERVRVGKQQVIGKFDRDDNELVYDSFNLRWLKCRFCGEIKPEGEMATYGGREGAKMGTCRECSRRG